MSEDRYFRPSPHLLSTLLLMRMGPGITLLCEAFPKPTGQLIKLNRIAARHCILWALRALCSHVEAAITGHITFPERAIFHPHLFPVTLDLWSPPQWKGVKKASLLLLTVLAQEVRNVEVSHQRKSEWPSPEIFIEASFSILEPRRNTNQ